MLAPSVPTEATGTALGGGPPARSAADELSVPEGTREVTGWDGTFEEAVEMGMVIQPKPLRWQEWLRWRKFYGARPTPEEDPPDTLPSMLTEGKI